jgi:hypothetical protein
MSTVPLRRGDFTDSYLLYYSGEHVWYETCMFFLAAFAMLSGTELHLPSEGLVFLVKNATVEAFGLHLRNLLDFFRPDAKKPKNTDVLAADYFDDGRLPDDFPELSQLAKSARVRANKEIAHLTTERKKSSDPAKSWPVKELTQEMLELVKHFVQGASTTRLDSGYISRTKQMFNL